MTLGGIEMGLQSDAWRAAVSQVGMSFEIQLLASRTSKQIAHTPRGILPRSVGVPAGPKYVQAATYRRTPSLSNDMAEHERTSMHALAERAGALHNLILEASRSPVSSYDYVINEAGNSLGALEADWKETFDLETSAGPLAETGSEPDEEALPNDTYDGLYDIPAWLVHDEWRWSASIGAGVVGGVVSAIISIAIHLLERLPILAAAWAEMIAAGWSVAGIIAFIELVIELLETIIGMGVWGVVGGLLGGILAALFVGIALGVLVTILIVIFLILQALFGSADDEEIDEAELQEIDPLNWRTGIGYGGGCIPTRIADSLPQEIAVLAGMPGHYVWRPTTYCSSWIRGTR